MAEIIPYEGGEQAQLRGLDVRRDAAARFQQAAIQVGRAGREGADYIGRGLREVGQAFTEGGQILKQHGIHAERAQGLAAFGDTETAFNQRVAEINLLPADQRSAALGEAVAQANQRLASIGENSQFEENRDYFLEHSQAIKQSFARREMLASAAASGAMVDAATQAFNERNTVRMALHPDAQSIDELRQDFDRTVAHTADSPQYRAGIAGEPGAMERHQQAILATRQKAVAAAIRMAIEAHPEQATSLLQRFAGDISIEQQAELTGLGPRMIRENEREARFQDSEARRQARESATNAERDFYAGMLDPQAPDGLRVDPDVMAHARQLQQMPGARPNAGIIYLHANEQVLREQTAAQSRPAGAPKPTTDDATYYGLQRQFADPEADPKAIISNLTALKAQGIIDNQTYALFLSKARAPAPVRAAQAQLWGFMDKAMLGDQRLQQAPVAFMREMQKRFDAGLALGQKPEEMIDPNSKVYIGRDYNYPVLTPGNGPPKAPLQEFFNPPAPGEPSPNPRRPALPQGSAAPNPAAEVASDVAAAAQEAAQPTAEPEPPTANFAKRSGLFGNPSEPGWRQENLVTINTRSGAEFQVHKLVAPAFQGFLNALEASGYHIKPDQSFGYAFRNITHGNELSEHAYGDAIDINAQENPYSRSRLVTNLPANVRDLAKQYGLVWGGSWKSPIDPMHFEATEAALDYGGAGRTVAAATTAAGRGE